MPKDQEETLNTPDLGPHTLFTFANERPNGPIYYYSTYGGVPPSFEPQGPASFDVFREQAPGSVPVYKHTIRMNNKDKTEVYHYSRDRDLPHPPWTNGGAVFYAYAEQRPGSVPVYEFTNLQSGTQVYFYSSIDNPPPGYSKPKKESPSFWAPAIPHNALDLGPRTLFTFTLERPDGPIYYYSTFGGVPTSFKAQGPASFEVFREQAPGSVQVYKYTTHMQDGTLIYYYSRDPKPPSKAWSGPSMAFYAYAEEHPNSVPVYCFSKEQSGTKVYFYSSFDNRPPGYSKPIEESPSFWAPASSQPLYTYINKAALGWVYYYSIKRYTPQSFQAAGPATFNAFDKPAFNRVPVYRFTLPMRDGTLVYFYSRDKEIPNKGWEGPVLAFYAYAEERPGSVPVYCFTKKESGTQVYFYSSIDKPPKDYSKKGFLSFYAPAPVPDPLSTFDHVVVLMLENRSLDNLLGYLYPTGVPKSAPLGKTFEGLNGQHVSNPVPKSAKHQPPDGSGSVPETSAENYFTPYPDPGEEYQHINVQLYQTPTPASGITDKPAGMQGFVQDYIDTCKSAMVFDPTFKQYQQIMQSFSDDDVPVLSTLAREFAVFDHWFCSVPSQTWCNRAFWHSGSSRGWVNNDPPRKWYFDKVAPTLFNQIHESNSHQSGQDLSWRIYYGDPQWLPKGYLSLTCMIDWNALWFGIPSLFEHVLDLDTFFSDCENGQLPSYSFLEPRFITPHNDMHPSTWGSLLWGKGKVGSVELGEQLVARVYNAIRNSKSTKGNNASNTLLIITFDEHGGTYDHVPPPTKVTPPDLSDFGNNKEDGFDFTRPGLRVPTIMVSAHIARNTVVNTSMDHTSFLKTIHKKWNAESEYQFQALSAREQASPDFAEVFTSQKPRDAAHWPVIDEPKIPKEVWEADYSQEPLSGLQRSIVEGLKIIRREQEGETARSADLKAEEETEIKTIGQALEFLKSVSREGLKNG